MLDYCLDSGGTTTEWVSYKREALPVLPKYRNPKSRSATTPDFHIGVMPGERATPDVFANFAQRQLLASVIQKFESVLEEGEQVEPLVPPVAKHGRAQEKSFAAGTASSTGMTKQAINRHVARAEALGPDLDRVVGTSSAATQTPDFPGI